MIQFTCTSLILSDIDKVTITYWCVWVCELL